MMNKLGAVFWIAALALSLLASARRRVLWSRWLAAGAALAALIVLPHLLPQQLLDVEPARSLPRGVIVLGGRAEDHARNFDEVEEVERLAPNPWVMPYEDRLRVFVLRGPRVDLGSLFQTCRVFI